MEESPFFSLLTTYILQTENPSMSPRSIEKHRDISSHAGHTHRCRGAAASIWADRAGEKDQAFHPRPRLNLFCFSRRVTGAFLRAFLLEFFTDDPHTALSLSLSLPQIHIPESSCARGRTHIHVHARPSDLSTCKSSARLRNNNSGDTDISRACLRARAIRLR